MLNIAFLSGISGEWVNLHRSVINVVSNVAEADYIVYESNGDPVHIINAIKMRFPKNKLVFILSGDQYQHIDDECVWFSNAVDPVKGLAKHQTQIYVSNPAIFKYYRSSCYSCGGGSSQSTDIYFKGTIWNGMRTEMFNYFSNKPKCIIVKNNEYWGWRLNSTKKPTQEELEETANDTYMHMKHAKLCLCPKGNGNSSMRIIEALACGCIPVLINDFTTPFNMKWNDICLVFDTSKHSWDIIYGKCMELIGDNERLQNMQQKGHAFFKQHIYGDSQMNGFRMYNDINTVCFGFSNKIVTKLIELHTTTTT